MNNTDTLDFEITPAEVNSHLKKFLLFTLSILTFLLQILIVAYAFVGANSTLSAQNKTPQDSIMTDSCAIIWPQDNIIYCIESTDPQITDRMGVPSTGDCTELTSIDYTDEISYATDCAEIRATISRSWTAEIDGVSETHTQSIQVSSITMEAIEFPEDITLEEPLACNRVEETIDDIENTSLRKTSVLHPNNLGKPMLQGVELVAGLDVMCDFAIGFEDRVLEICAHSFQIFRTWEINDLCSSLPNGIKTISHTQLISVSDNRGPEVVADFTEAIISVDEGACVSNAALPLPIYMKDACSTSEFELIIDQGVTVDVQGTPDDSLSIHAVDLPIGSYSVQYIFTDECNNRTEHTFTLLVKDQKAPVPVCADPFTIKLDQETGLAVATIAEMNRTISSDNCGRYIGNIIRGKDFNAGIVEYNDGTQFNINGMPGYHAYTDCMVDGIAMDSVLDRQGELIWVKEYPYVMPSASVSFCCEDVGTQELVLILMDEYGNVGTCQTTVTIEEDITRELSCESFEVTCQDDLYGDTRMPVLETSACGDIPRLDYIDDESGITSCGAGQLIRTWYIDENENNDIDSTDLQCSQIISISDDASFDPYSIKWPVHYDSQVVSGLALACGEDGIVSETPVSDIKHQAGSACTYTAVADEPTWCVPACQLVTATVVEEEVTLASGCMAMIRRHTVIDWCIWQENGSVRDDSDSQDKDNFEAIQDLRSGGCVSCGDQEVDPEVYYRYTTGAIAADGYYTYDQIIEITDDSAPVISVSNTLQVSCISEVLLTATATDLCDGQETDPSELSWQVEVLDADGHVVTMQDGGDFITSSGASASIGSESQALGNNYQINWTVSDRCGNTDTKSTLVNFADQTAPVVSCYDKAIEINIQSSETVVLGLSDLMVSAVDECSSQIDYIITKVDEKPYLPEVENLNDYKQLTIDCALAEQSLLRELWIWDEAGNLASCEVRINISGTCESAAALQTNTIAGAVYTDQNEMMTGATIHIESMDGLAEYPQQRISGNSGLFAFPDNPAAHNYMLRAEKTDRYKNGVSTIDIVMVQKHILGISELTNPYQIIAADVNGDQQITSLDLIAMRKLVLNEISQFKTGKSWIFIDKKQEFNHAFSPWPLKEQIEVMDLSDDMMDQAFVAIKVGDVNQDADINGLAKAELRTEGMLSFIVKDTFIHEGQELEIPVKAENFIRIYGYQFTLNHPGLEVMEVNSSSLAFQESFIKQHEGMSIVSWNDIQSISTNDVLFTLKVKATESQLLSQSLHINSEMLKAEAYQGDRLKVLDVSLNFETDHRDFEVLQNKPNPFHDVTRIPFSIPVDGQVTLRVFDAAGKLVKNQTAQYAKGYHEIELSADDLHGVYHYQLINGYQSITKKMIILK